MNDTPETDGEWNRIACYDHPQFEQGIAEFARKLERERDEWKAKFLQQNKDLGCELRDPNGTIWSHAATVERERDEAIKAIKSAKAYKRVLKNENARLRRMLNLPENA
jgi:hypothetical protein